MLVKYCEDFKDAKITGLLNEEGGPVDILYQELGLLLRKGGVFMYGLLRDRNEAIEERRL
jgi:hypothetical protein